jgi:hypothetical protein
MQASPLYAVPEEMRLLPNWVLWKLTPVEGKKPTKIPYSVKGYRASSTDPSTWATFEVTFNALQLGGYDGLGFNFSNTPYAGIDLDDPTYLRDGVTPNPDKQLFLDRQIKIAQEFDSYSEVSPSGTGLHIIVRGSVPSGHNRDKIEIYSSERFFTMTGNVYNNKPIADRQDLLVQLWKQIGGAKETVIANDKPEEETDAVIIARAMEAVNGDKFKLLNEGNWKQLYPSQSEADYAFIDIIAFYTQNRLQIGRIFRASKLGARDKAKRKDYVEGMITRSFDRQPQLVNVEGFKEELEQKIAARIDKPIIDSSPDVKLPTGLVGEIASFIYASAPRPVKEVALAGAIGLMAGICGRAYNISGTGLNQYVLFLASTGTGKEAAAQGINKIMDTVRFTIPTSNSFIGPSEIASGAALFKHLANTSQSFVSMLGEFGLRLEQMASPKASGAEVSLRRMFLDLYNKSGQAQVLHQSVYSDKANNTSSVQSPAFSVLGESTPERFYGALNEDMISEGLLPRFLIIEYKGKRPINNEGHDAITVPHKLTDKLGSLIAHCESINKDAMRKPLSVETSIEAKRLLSDFDKYADDKINNSDKEVVKQLWNRAHMKVLKIAALLAVGENMVYPQISLDNFNYAANLVQADIDNITAKFDSGLIGGNSFELKQHAELKRIAHEYATKDFAYCSKYKAPFDLHKDKILPYAYISNRLDKIACFKNDRAGSGNALKRTVQAFIDSGFLIEQGGPEFKLKYKTNQKAYTIHSSILD